MLDDRHDPVSLADAAGDVLSNKFGERVRLRPAATFKTGASVVVRCEVSGAGGGLPESLIVKKVREDEFAYRPESPEAPNPAHWLFNDWAAAEFLNQVPGPLPLSPTLYAGSVEHGLLVLEDLGDGEPPNTRDALLGADPELAEQTLIEHVSLIGRLHAATAGRAEEYGRIRRRLGPPPRPAGLYQDPWADARNAPVPAAEVEEVIELYRALSARVGARPPAGVGEEIARVTAHVEGRPGQFLAFCKGDQGMAGDYLRRHGRPRLFDFNAGGFRHALVEGMPGRLTWGCLMRLPGRLLPLMDAAYRAEFARAHPAVSDEAFRRAAGEAGARWHILHVVHRLPEALSGDRPRGPTTLRQQVLAWLKAFADLSEEFGGVEALGSSARRMAERLGRAWPAGAGAMPFYPAFRGEEPGSNV